MRSLGALICALVVLIAPAQALSPLHRAVITMRAKTHVSSTIGPCGYGSDGYAGAPSGSAQYPTLLDGARAAHRPPWCVAGVDYALGYPSGQSFADPTTSPPAGTSYNAGQHKLTVSSNSVDVNGFDFTVSGGVQIAIGSGVTGTIIENSKFGASANAFGDATLIRDDGAGATIRNNIFSNDTQGNVAYLKQSGGGTVTLQYNLCAVMDGDCFDINTSAKVLIKYNACVSTGMDPASHPDCVQLTGTGSLDPASVEQYNLVWQPNTVGTGGAEGIQVAVASLVVTGYAVDHNTVLADCGGPGFSNGTCTTSMSYGLFSDNAAAGVVIQTNYFDMSGAGGYIYAQGAASNTCSGNVAITTALGVTAGSNITGTFGSMTCN